MASTPLLIMAIVATMAAGANAIGSCASNCYGFVTMSIGCGDSAHALDCFCKTYKDPESLSKVCANKCLHAWDDRTDTMLCPHIEAADDMATSTGHPTDVLERISLEDIIANIPEYNHHAGATEASDRIALARNARMRRRAVVADATFKHNAEHSVAEGATVHDTHNRQDAGAEAVSQPTSSSLLERFPQLSKRDGGDRPKWQPTVCTAPGVTCAGGGDGGSGTKVESRNEADSNTQMRSSRLFSRAAHPLSKLPGWWPLLCGSWGLTCAQSGNSDDESTGNAAESSSVSEVKRKAQPLPDFDNEPNALKEIPKWHPTSCTSRGITCADSGDSTGDNIGTRGESRESGESVVDTEPKSLRKIPPWHPTSCTAPGITCGDNGNHPADTSDSGGDTGEPKSLRVIPPWHPTSCTAPGITCGDNGNPPADTSDAGDGTGEASSATSHAETNGKIVERDPEAFTGVQTGGFGGDDNA